MWPDTLTKLYRNMHFPSIHYHMEKPVITQNIQTIIHVNTSDRIHLARIQELPMVSKTGKRNPLYGVYTTTSSTYPKRYGAIVNVVTLTELIQVYEKNIVYVVTLT